MIDLVIFVYYIFTIIVAYLDCYVLHLVSNAGDSDRVAVFKGVLWPFFIKTYNPVKILWMFIQQAIIKWPF